MYSQWDIREATGSDLHYIYSTWLNSYRVDSVIGKTVLKSVFFDNYYEVIDCILSKKTTKVLIACSNTEANIIFGYLVYEPFIAHYFFTKEDFRNSGVARSLYWQAFSTAGAVPCAIQFTHKTKHAGPVLDKHPALLYNPFLLFNREIDTKKDKKHAKT